MISGSDLNKLQDVLRSRHQQRSVAQRQKEEELVSLSFLVSGKTSFYKVASVCTLSYHYQRVLLMYSSPPLPLQALLYADPFDVEAQKKIEAAIRQVIFFLT